MNGETQRSNIKTSSIGDRRGFLVKSAAIVIGGIVAAVPFLIGLVSFLDPLRRKSDGGSFIRISPLDALPADGVPRRFAVMADRIDAWNFYPKEPIGAVYLRRTAEDTIQALNSTCPHAGCFVDFNDAAHCFKCPCHNSTFTPAGAILQPSPSPRPMDTLVVDVRGNEGAKEIWVQFENFYTGIAEKVPKA